MNLLQIRTKFIELSGRYDLVVDTTDYVDNGANFYITAGQEFLDRRSNVWKKKSWIFESIAAGVWYVKFQRCRVMESVFVNSATGRSKLVKKDLLWLYEEFSEPITDASNSTPLYFAPAILRTEDSTDKDVLGSFFNYIVASDDPYRGMVILPPPDEAVVVSILGQFYSAELSDDTDENFWSIMHSSLLILASLYQLEVLGHRNTQGSKDYLEAIDIALIDIDKDIAGEESNDVDQLDG